MLLAKGNLTLTMLDETDPRPSQYPIQIWVCTYTRFILFLFHALTFKDFFQVYHKLLQPSSTTKSHNETMKNKLRYSIINSYWTEKRPKQYVPLCTCIQWLWSQRKMKAVAIQHYCGDVVKTKNVWSRLKRFLRWGPPWAHTITHKYRQKVTAIKYKITGFCNQL